MISPPPMYTYDIFWPLHWRIDQASSGVPTAVALPGPASFIDCEVGQPQGIEDSPWSFSVVELR